MAIYRTWADKSELPTELRESNWMTVQRMPDLRDGDTITIDTQHMFTDQCNVGSMRLFDSAEMLYASGAHSGSGYYLELEPHDIAARNETLKCGYCGQHYGEHHESHWPLTKQEKADLFCRKCIGSPNLTVDDIKRGINRLYRVSDMRDEFHKKPTQQQFTSFLSSYDHAQAEARKLRIEQRKKLERARVEQKLREAQAEYDGKMWLLDRDYELDNVIYYTHTKLFGFGWREPLTAEEELHLRVLLEDAPFTFEIKAQ